MFVNSILSFSVVGLWTIRVKSPGASSLRAVLHSPAKDMTIIICHNKPPDRKWSWSVDDVTPRKDGPENLRILKRRVEIKPMRQVLDFDRWGIELDLGRWRRESLPTEILNITRCAACCDWVSIVWLAKTFKNCVSLLVLPRTKVRSK